LVIGPLGHGVPPATVSVSRKDKSRPSRR
jgi:hypothetical protein